MRETLESREGTGIERVSGVCLRAEGWLRKGWWRVEGAEEAEAVEVERDWGLVESPLVCRGLRGSF